MLLRGFGKWLGAATLTVGGLLGGLSVALTQGAVPASANETGGDSRCVASGNSAADAYNAAFGSPIGFWQAGDVAQNYPLPDGRTLWILNDSYINSTSPAGPLTDKSTFIRNVAVMQTGNCFETIAGIQPPDPTIPIDPLNPPPNPTPQSFFAAFEVPNDTWWWAHGGIVVGDTLNIFFTLMHQTGAAGWGINFAPFNTVILTFNWHTMAYVSAQAAPNGGVSPIYGFSVASDDNWTYLFGASGDLRVDHASNKNYVARVTKGHIFDAPQYWNGSTWVYNAAAAANISSQGTWAYRLNVMHDDDRWVAVAKPDEFFGSNLAILEAPEPQGPWVITQNIPLATKTGDGNSVTYEPIAYPTLRDGKLLVNWSNNHYAYPPVAANPWLYRPRFASVALGAPTQSNSICHGDQPGRTSSALVPGTPSRFVPVAPKRLYDSRGGAKVPADGVVTVNLATSYGIPKDRLAAATLNVTLDGATAAGYATVWPSAQARPLTSNLNADAPGVTVPNLVTVPVDADGNISIYVSMSSHLIVDGFGWYERVQPSTSTTTSTATSTTTSTTGPTATPPAPAELTATAGRTIAVMPTRLLDTRSTGAVRPPGVATTIPVLGRGGVPVSGVAAAILTVTATDVRGNGYVSATPALIAPTTSNLNVLAGDTRANQVIVPIGSDGAVRLFASSPMHLVADIVGYVTDDTAPASSSGLFVPIAPTRLLDSRAAAGTPGAGCTATLTLPATATAAVTNVTLTGNTRVGYATAWPHGTPMPATSTLNLDRLAETRPNHAIVPLGSGGTFDIYLSARTHLVVDLAGYIT